MLVELFQLLPDACLSTTSGLQICCRLFVRVSRQSNAPYFLG